MSDDLGMVLERIQKKEKLINSSMSDVGIDYKKTNEELKKVSLQYNNLNQSLKDMGEQYRHMSEKFD